MLLREKPLETRRGLGERKALACVVCLLLLGWGWLVHKQPAFVGFDTIKEALTSKTSLQASNVPIRWRAACLVTLQHLQHSFLRLVKQGLIVKVVFHKLVHTYLGGYWL